MGSDAVSSLFGGLYFVGFICVVFGVYVVVRTWRRAFLRARGASDRGYMIRPVIFLRLVYRLLARIVSSWVEQR